MTVETDAKVKVETGKEQTQTAGADGPATLPNTTGWVHFEEEANPPAVINAESVQVSLSLENQPRSNNNSSSSSSSNNNGVVPPLSDGPAVQLPAPLPVQPPPEPRQGQLQTVQLQVQEPSVRQGFSNGDVIVTLLPVNTRFPWITPARFRPELVPEELMAQGLTLTVEEYVQAMELLVNDVRFTLYTICYKRILVVWIALAFTVLLGLLFSGQTGLTLFALGVAWLVLNASAIFLSMWLKFRLARELERCMANVNKHLLRHKMVVALDDRGRISCHKVNLCFLYLDPAPCIAHLQAAIEQQEKEPSSTSAAGSNAGSNWEQRMDISAGDIVIQGSRTTRLSRKQGRAEQVLTRYLQRWGKDFLRRRLDWTFDDASGTHSSPRHLSTALCPCQYAEEILHNKPKEDERAALLYLRYVSRWGRQMLRGALSAEVTAQPGRHCATTCCPCQYVEEHLHCKPGGKLTLARLCHVPDQPTATRTCTVS